MMHGIKADNFEEFIKLNNEFSKNNNVFATQTHIDTSNKSCNIFYAFRWYNTKEQEKPRQEPQEQQIKAVNPITPSQYKALCLLSKDLEGEEYLKSKGIHSEKDIEKLSKKEAWQIMHDRGN